jgi:battenin
MCASFSSSYGEISFLSMSTLYSRRLSLNGWSSGTGAAGLIGSFSYASLTTLGLSPSSTILCMLFIPFLMLTSYSILPNKDFKNYLQIESDTSDTSVSSSNSNNSLNEANVLVPDNSSTIQNYDDEIQSVNNNADLNSNNRNLSFSLKFQIFRSVIKYMIPLGLVYLFEYFINQGLFELLYFKDSFLKQHKMQYR